MAIRRRETKSEDGGVGAPEWMLTYSDCMTLLLTFFVLLISFSSFDEKVYRKVESAFTEGLSSIGVRPVRDNLALESRPQIVHEQELVEGSEQPTVEGQYESNPNQSLDFLDFQNQKVFLLRSDRVFLGRGTRISRRGAQLLSDIAVLLKATGDRIVVSEHGLENGDPDAQRHREDPRDLGLRRAWYVMEFLAVRQGLEKTRFSLSSEGTVAMESLLQSSLFAGSTRNGAAGRSFRERVVEITALERSLYR